jgi:hypothetical protein
MSVISLVDVGAIFILGNGLVNTCLRSFKGESLTGVGRIFFEFFAEILSAIVEKYMLKALAISR